MSEKLNIYNFIYENRDTDYVKRLFNLYKRDKGIKEDISLSDRYWLNDMVRWVKYNREMSEVFINNVDNEFLLPIDIIEVGKGFLNTDLFSLRNAGYDVCELSYYSDTFGHGVNTINGRLDYGCGEGKIVSSTYIKPLTVLDGRTLFTTLSASDVELYAMIRCLNDGYDCLFGFYSDMDYKSYSDKIDRLKDLKTIIQQTTGLNVNDYQKICGDHSYNALYVKGRK